MAESKFVKELPDDYLCMICAKVLNEPHLTDCCGQHFCQACLEQWFKKQHKKICPHCRSESFTHMRSLPLKRKIDDLKVYCPNQADGCEVITKFGELHTHMNACDFAKVICTQGCRKTIVRKDLMQHCSNECSKRKIKCKYCGKEDHYETILGKHTSVCQEYLVNCPRGCTLIKRKDLAKHTDFCPLEKVQCLFNEAGCDATFLRKDFSAHMEISTQKHLIMVMLAYNKLKVEHANLHSEHSSLKEEFKKQSFQVTSPMLLVEPVKLTNENETFSFSITSSQGWISPPFCVQDGYTFCIKHMTGRAASLMLLKGKNDDNLKWPMNLQYRLKILLEMQRGTTAHMQRSTAHPSQRIILDYDLSANLERISAKDCSSKEIANITLPMTELLNCTMTAKLITAKLITAPSMLMGYAATWQCKKCNGTIPGVTFKISICPLCHRQQI